MADLNAALTGCRWISEIRGPWACWSSGNTSRFGVWLAGCSSPLVRTSSTVVGPRATSCYDPVLGVVSSSSWKLKWKTSPRPESILRVVGLPRSVWHAEATRTHRAVLCDQSEETLAHILNGSSFSCTVWHEVLSWMRSTVSCPLVGIGCATQFWTPLRKAWPQPSCWWHGASGSTAPHRTAIIFDHAHRSMPSLLDTIKLEARQWVTVGARGLAAVLPVEVASSD